MTRPLFLGVDGGGTKTEFVLVDRDGTIAATHQGPGSYHLEIGIDGVRSVLGNGLAALFRQAAIDGNGVAHAYFGLPAHGEGGAADAMLDAIPALFLGHERYHCGNDVVCAWAGSLGGEDGIGIVAGTGSIAYGERQGRSARAGGWGELFGDEGSAHWIALQGLSAFSRMSDGRLARGPLHAVFRAALELGADIDLCALVMNSPARARVASLSRLVARAAHEGDAVAIGIFSQAAHELAAIADAVRRALGYEPGEAVPVSYSGGVFEAGPLILAPLVEHLGSQAGVFRLDPPLVRPGIGAAIYAARCAATPLTRATLERLIRS